MKFLKTYSSSFYILFLFFLLFLSHTIFYLKYLNVFFFFLLILFIATISFFKEIPFPKFSLKYDLKKIKVSNVIITLIIILPSILYLSNTSFGDFNWGGDHRDHVLSSLVNNEFWLSAITSERDTIQNFDIKNILFSFYKIRIFLLFLVIGLTIFLYKKNYGNLANIILFVIFYIWSSTDLINNEKDPRGLFFISLPVNSLFYLFDLNLMDAIRYTNFFSIIFWLLILRPLIIEEYPNLKILPFALAIYWNPQMIFLTNGSHVDPWSIIFFLLALEIVIKKNYNFTPQAIILLGIGACFKSYVALLMPFFFLYGKPWIKDNKRRLIHCFALISSILPVYFFTNLRSVGSYWQPIKFQNYGFTHLDNNYLYLAYIQFENYKYILIIFFICLFIFFKNFFKNKWEYSFFLLTPIFIFSIFFFNDLNQMMQHVMYFRYYVLSFLMIFGFILIKSMTISNKNIMLMILATIFTYSFDLVNMMKVNKDNLYKLNFSFFINSDPLYLGLDPLIKENKELLNQKKINEVFVSRSTRIIYKIPGYLYEDIKISESITNQPICECSEEKRAIINFFPKIRGPLLKYNKNLPVHPEGWGELFGNTLEVSKNKCIKKMNNSCSIVKFLKEEDDEEVIATLGVE